VTHDVFISYSAHDKAVADALCATLESRKIRCWIAPRDVLPGMDYPAALIEALNNSRIFVLIFSKESNESNHVMREVQVAVSNGIPIIPLRIEDVKPTESMQFFLCTPHWLDAMTPPLEKHLQRLADTVQTLLTKNPEPKPETPITTSPPLPPTKPKPKPKTKYIIAAIVTIAIILIAVFFATGGFAGPSKLPTPSPSNQSTPMPSVSESNSQTPSPPLTTITPEPTTSIPLSANALTTQNAAQVKLTGQIPFIYVNHITYSPDGKMLAVSALYADIYDAKTLTKIYSIPYPFRPGDLAFSPDSHLILVADIDSLYVFNTDGWGQTLFINNTGEITSVAFSPDGKTIATAVGSAVKLWDVTSGNELQTVLSTYSAPVVFAPDAKTFVTTGGFAGEDIKIYDVQSSQELKTLPGGSSWVECLALSPNGQILASGTLEGLIRLWSTTSGQQIRVLTGHTDRVSSLAFSPDGQLLASVSWDLTVRIWNVQTGQQLKSLTGHTSTIKSVAFSPDGSTIASGGGDSNLRLWGIG
jgi:WD40 repeat protein